MVCTDLASVRKRCNIIPQNRNARYKFGRMVIGESFTVPLADREKVRRAIQAFQKLPLASHTRFYTAKEGNRVRVGRMA